MADTRTDFALRVARLHAAQTRGDLPPPGRIPAAELARQLGMTDAALARLAAVALAKFAAGLRARGVTAADIPNRD
jgi:hypothetical protein